MKVCIPTAEDQGLQAEAYGHFGSAPYFVISDTESRETKTVDNRDRDHEHGACLPVAALGEEGVDAVVVAGIGGRALARLNRRGIAVYQATPGTVAENLEALSAGRLPELDARHACRGHGHER